METNETKTGEQKPASTNMNTAMNEILQDDTIETTSLEQESPSTNINTDMSEFLENAESISDSGEVDYEAHFQSGINYRRDGLLDEAVRELQIAAEDPEKTVRNSRMLALCYMEKGSYDSAAKEFKKVIEAMTPDETGYLDIMYELAEAYFKNKDNDNALKAYDEIHSQDPGFRDVSQRLEVLNAGLIVTPDTPEPEPEQQSEQTAEKTLNPKKSRISYL